MSCCKKEEVKEERKDFKGDFREGDLKKDYKNLLYELDLLLLDLEKIFKENPDKINAQIFMSFYDRAFNIYTNWEVYFFSEGVEPFIQKILEFLKDKSTKQKSITYKIFAYYWRIPDYLGIYKEEINRLQKEIKIIEEIKERNYRRN